MEFEEMKKIWDTQNKKLMYAIDEKKLHEITERKINATSRIVNFYDWMFLFVTIIVAAVLSIDAVFDDSYSQLIPAGTALIVSVYVLMMRKKRKGQNIHYDNTLLGDLEKAISDAEFLIRQGENLLWWYILPFGGAIMISTILSSEFSWAWILMMLVFVLGYFAGKWEIRKWHIPRKKSLEALKKTLLQDSE